MAGWSRIANEAVVDCWKTPQKVYTNGLRVEFEPCLKRCAVETRPDKLRCLFNELFTGNNYRPFLPMLGDGISVDLFKLFFIVREKGGYDTVSKQGLWNSVAEESGLCSSVSSAVKLIYVKYLDVFERFLEELSKDKNSEGGLRNRGADLGGYSMELETDLKGLLSEISDQKKKGEEFPQLDLMSGLTFTNVGKLCNSEELIGLVELDGSKKFENTKRCLDLTGLSLSPAGKLSNGEEVRLFVESDDGNKCIDEGENVVILDSNVANEVNFSRKRKRGSLWGCLNWITETAKNPCDPVIGTLPEWSKWKSHGNDEFWKQVLLAREAMFIKRQGDSSAEQSIWQKKQRMHPCMYEDHIISNQFTDRLRSSQRILSVKKSRTELPSSCTQSDVNKTRNPGRDQSTNISFPEDSLVYLFGESHIRKRIPVGPLFQAKVPEWNGTSSESDSKWLGTQIWPLDKGEKRPFLIERDRIGKGRQESCGCELQGSIECVRFHIIEKSKKVKCELGSAFSRWKFDNMGDEVALSWKQEDEKKFRDVVRLNPPSLDKCFWDEIFKSFPNKTREELVSYYFNVFLLRRRGCQNRSTPTNIDSDDDDESEFGAGTSNSVGSSSIFLTPTKAHKNLR